METLAYLSIQSWPCPTSTAWYLEYLGEFRGLTHSENLSMSSEAVPVNSISL
jgi:hypothetical protein